METGVAIVFASKGEKRERKILEWEETWRESDCDCLPFSALVLCGSTGSISSRDLRRFGLE